MIEIKSLFTAWHETTREQAKKYAKWLYNNITTMRESKRIEYIETSRLRGISFAELMKD